MNRQTLTKRLQTVYDLATSWRNKTDGGRRLIDVGSDHGFVSLEGLVTGDYDYVIATDIHKNPAEKSRELLVINGYEACSEVFCTDGLDDVPLRSGDVVIMAGLGGNNMMDILTRVMEVTSPEVLSTVVFCLQPQKTIEELRVFLGESGFSIMDEDVVCERNIYYPMLVTIFDGESHSISLKEKYYGPVMLSKFEEGNSDVTSYFAKLDEVLTVRSRGDMEIRDLLSQIGKL